MEGHVRELCLMEGKTQCPFHTGEKQNQAFSQGTSCRVWKDAEDERGLPGRGGGRGNGLEEGVLLAVPGGWAALGGGVEPECVLGG